MTTPNGQIVADDLGRASLFASTFASVFPNSQPTTPIDLTNVEIPSCSPTVVLDLLSRINVLKAPGPDGIHLLILKRLPPYIASPLAHLFSASI